MPWKMVGSRLPLKEPLGHTANTIASTIRSMTFTTMRPSSNFGIGRATYDASQEIRNEEITREEGVALVKKYDGEIPGRFSKEIFKYLSIPAKEFPVASQQFEQPEIDWSYFHALADSFRSPHLWVREFGQWKLRRAVWYE